LNPMDDLIVLILHASFRAGVVVRSVKWKQVGFLRRKKEMISVEMEEKTLDLKPAALEAMTIEELAEKLT